MILQMRVMKNLLQILNFQRKMTKSQVIVLQCIKLNQDYDRNFLFQKMDLLPVIVGKNADANFK